MKEQGTFAFGCLFAVAFMAFGIFQISAGFVGIEHNWGQGWAIGAIVIIFLFRVTIPIAIGCFFCATDIWGWPWYGALVFAAPGVLFMVPAVFTGLIEAVKR